ncbi:MAG: hypothetical protein JKY37_27085 [Nannocystaceae bacterium]|nr:hypothetical protein [Nannocystaceae bacterium]
MARAAQLQVQALYGGATAQALAVDAGVLHVAAVWRRTPDSHVVMRIGPETPKSQADAFALSLARARADAILTTGGILRAEPEMVVRPFGANADSLLALRRTAFNRNHPPALIVLTRGEIAVDHPALHTWVRPVIITGRVGAQRLKATLGSRTDIRLVALPEPSAAAAIAWAQRELGARTISIEAGPSTAVPLYEHPVAIDELMLSVYEGTPPAAVVGKPFVSPAQIDAALPRCVADTAVDEVSGPWRFQRWLRPAQ